MLTSLSGLFDPPLKSSILVSALLKDTESVIECPKYHSLHNEHIKVRRGAPMRKTNDTVDSRIDDRWRRNQARAHSLQSEPMSQPNWRHEQTPNVWKQEMHSSQPEPHATSAEPELSLVQVIRKRKRANDTGLDTEVVERSLLKSRLLRATKARKIRAELRSVCQCPQTSLRLGRDSIKGDPRL